MSAENLVTVTCNDVKANSDCHVSTGGTMFLRHITDGNLLGIRITTQRYHSPVASSTNAIFGHRKLRVYGTQLLFRVMGERRVSHKHKGNVLSSCVTQAYMNALDATPLTKKQLGKVQVCEKTYLDTNFLFLGGLMVAIAVEKCFLHKRLALGALLIVGSQPQRLMLGFMVVTAIMSMWISNTATAAMMVPIVHSVLEQLRVNLMKAEQQTGFGASSIVSTGQESSNEVTEGVVQTDGTPEKEGAKEDEEGNPVLEVVNVDSPKPSNSPDENEKTIALTRAVSLRVVADTSPSTAALVQQKKEEFAKQKNELLAGFEDFSRAMRLSVAYAANVGGTATITGSPTNLVAKEMLDQLSNGEYELSFFSWFVIAFPNACLSLAWAWFWLLTYNMGFRFFLASFSKDTGEAKRVNDASMEVLKEEYKSMGKMSFAEKAVLIHFILLALLWFTRNPGFVKGWAVLFKSKYVTDGTVGITIGVSLFVFPSRMPSLNCFSKSAAPALLDWATVNRKMAWNVILLMGGGFALADACKTSGLSKAVGKVLNKILLLPPTLTVFVLCLLVSIFSEVTSNTTTNTLFLQVLGALAIDLEINPLYVMIPVTICASCAFMLPVATPPNAIVFSYGDNLRISDMIKSGWMMNLMCIVIVQLGTNTWAYSWFDYGHVPEWAVKNKTIAKP
ncbi:hypothetical protein NP493_1219g00000 [Ridgeia piscesae]|uniref:Uncharacterized protein n=1 Tax=Ridgeia piscesae TaxID=27915 RepID=A0AAD9NHG4_RIDPI|nr:hypothetical protein NP493_1219g00000 [Ridgeia piscesae]